MADEATESLKGEIGCAFVLRRVALLHRSAPTGLICINGGLSSLNLIPRMSGNG
jgi:hypothetical protein